MSTPVREEDSRKNACSSRGLGLAAAAIGVGVGAALYYFFNKQQDESQTSGSNTSGWNCEDQQAFTFHPYHQSTMSDSEYSPSEHSTTNTSINHSSSSSSSSSLTYYDSSNSSRILQFDSSASDYPNESGYMNSSISQTDSANENDNRSIAQSISSSTSEGETISTVPSFTVETMRGPVEASAQGSFNVGSDTDIEWDVTNNSLDVPRSDGPQLSALGSLMANFRSLLSANGRKSRQRRWSLEECSICCEIMLNDQPLKSLPCSHRFHTVCVTPWLEEHQTCPNCRKQA